MILPGINSKYILVQIEKIRNEVSGANRQLNIYAYDTIFDHDIFTASEATSVNNNAIFTLLNNKIETYNSDGVDQGYLANRAIETIDDVN